MTKNPQTPIAVLLCAAMLLVPAHAPAQQPASANALRIVVISGEDAINIIQQRTAVNPIVEVRDRNNLPVSGVAVTFSVGGQGASFAGGASTLTLTTNAAGQAVVTGLTPTATGAITINASAVVNGQAIAATITQTNFATAQAAAQAAATASGGSSGASTAGATAGGGGGGISATTIAIVGAVVGGGALAATQLTKDEEEGGTASFSGTFSGDLVLTFGAGASACTRLERHSGTLRVKLADISGALSGSTAEITNGVVAIISTTCTGGPQPGQTQTFGMPTAAVTGSQAALAFSQQLSAPSVDGSGTLVNQIYSFTGSLTGDAIAGTLTKLVRLELSPNPVTTSSLLSAAVTLTRPR